MAIEERSPRKLGVPKSDTLNNREAQCMAASLQEKRPSPEEFILSVASNIAAQPLQYFEPEVWGMLTAITANARKRRQGINIILTADEHRFGRLVPDKRFQIEFASVSANHCKIYRKRGSAEDSNNQSVFCGSVLLKDTSTNGTYLNWEKLTTNGPEAELRHGDIISFASPPHNENSIAFVYREVVKSATCSDGVAKRKAEEFGPESKRLKGIGIGAPDGPLSLDDFKSLQRSNAELRKQVENHVKNIDSLRNKNHALIEHREKKINEIKESVEKSYAKQLLELRQSMEFKQKDLEASNKTLSEQKRTIDDLSEKLTAYTQSIAEAKEIIASQKASISEMKKQLDDEREQWREEREKAVSDLKAAVRKAQSEAEEELKRLSEASCRRDREHQEVVNKLQESEKERCLLVDTLRTKLEDSRQKLVESENKVRQLETQLTDEKLISCDKRKKIEELEDGLKAMKEELESEKAAREEAWAKVSILELEISAALRDLEYERRRLRGARERIILRETQLRAFYSTTEEISSLFAKQQEQLKAMQKTLEDEENYASDSAEIDLNTIPVDAVRNLISGNKLMQCKRHCTEKEGSSTSANSNIQVNDSSDDVCDTEKHDCDHKSQEEFQNTQEVDSADVDRPVCADIYSGEEPDMEGDPISTEHVPDTESPEADNGPNHDPIKEAVLAGETMQVADETQAKETEDFAEVATKDSDFTSGQDNLGVATKTRNLLASEAAGSWACDKAPSAHCESDSPRIKCSNDEGVGFQHDSNTIVAESQPSPSPECFKMRRKYERQELSEMIGIVAPELKEKFSKVNANMKEAMWSNSDTEGVGSDEDDLTKNDHFRVEARDSDDEEGEYSKSGDGMNVDTDDDSG